MNKLLYYLGFMMMYIIINLFSFCYAQENLPNDTLNSETKKRSFVGQQVLSIGYRHGGGGVAGADLEFLISEQSGLRFGLGYQSMGAAFLVHVKPNNIRSLALGAQFLHYGFPGEKSFVASALGPVLLVRAPEAITASVGFSRVINRSPLSYGTRFRNNRLFNFSIGLFFTNQPKNKPKDTKLKKWLRENQNFD